jgi:hypothetical protein
MKQIDAPFIAAKKTATTINFDELAKSRKMRRKRRLRKKFCRQGAQIMRSEAYFYVRRNDEGCSATQHPEFLRSRKL